MTAREPTAEQKKTMVGNLMSIHEKLDNIADNLGGNAFGLGADEPSGDWGEFFEDFAHAADDLRDKCEKVALSFVEGLTDEDVIDVIVRLRNGGLRILKKEDTINLVAAQLGIAYTVAWWKMQDMEERRILDCGTSIRFPWLSYAWLDKHPEVKSRLHEFDGETA